jgi:hypothetical protein
MEVGGQSHTSATLAPGYIATVHIVEEDEWVSGSVWTDIEKRKSIALTGFRNLVRPAGSVSLSGLFKSISKTIPV